MTIIRSMLLLLVFTTGCATSSSLHTYAVTADKNYLQGKQALQEEAWLNAEKFFSFVKARFPYSQFAILAELGLADTQFGKKNYLQAALAYKLFLRFHPTHPQVKTGYVSMRIGKSYYNLLPSNVFFLPPRQERDMANVVQAHDALKKFTLDYTDSPYLEEVKTILSECINRLAEHEMYVALFYWRDEKVRSTISRLQYLITHYFAAPQTPQALWLLGSAYTKTGDLDKAQAAWNTLIKAFPQHDLVTKATEALNNKNT